MEVVLFVDMLGQRRRWQQGGTAEARVYFNRFSRMVCAAIRNEPSATVHRGGIETDGVMLVCESTVSALRIARRLFLWAFDNPKNPSAERLWLRGSVTPHDGSSYIRRESRAHTADGDLTFYTWSDAALDAISIEKSGFKGMRLLIREEAVDAATREAVRLTFRDYSFIPLKRLRHTPYPPVVKGKLLDFLWMACEKERDWQDIAIQMTHRLRHAAQDPEEFAQAAATQVVFHECAAIRQSIASRAKRASERDDGS